MKIKQIYEISDSGKNSSSRRESLRFLIGMFVVACIFTSCEDFFESSVEIDLPEQEQKIALHSFYHNHLDSTFRFLITRTKGVLENDSYEDFLNEADIRLVVDGLDMEVFSLPITEGNDNRKAFNFESEPIVLNEGAEVELTVEHPDHQTIFSSQYLPSMVVPDSVIFIPNAGLDQDGYRTSGMDIYFRDPPGRKNYYLVRVLRKDEPSQPGYPIYIESLDLAATQYSSDVMVDDMIFDGEFRRLRVFFNDWHGSNAEPDMFEVEWRSITPDLYLYGRAYERYYHSEDNPFTTPAQLYTNIENGVGIFAVSNTTTLTPR
jgi:hypothetical protein